MNILDDLWHGNIAPVESQNVTGADYRHALHEIIEKQEILGQMLPQEAKAVLNSCNDAQISLQAIAEREAFKQGFHLGARIVLDIWRAEKL